MPRIELDFTGADTGGAYPLLENGYYRLRLTKITFARAQSSNNRMIKTEWTVIAPRHRGGKLLHNFMILPQSMWALRNMLLALGAQVPTQKGVFNTDQWLNRECGAAVGQGELPASNGRPKRKVSQVTEWLTLQAYEALRTELGGAQPVAAVSAPTAEGAWDEESEDEFDEEAEPESEAAELPF